MKSTILRLFFILFIYFFQTYLFATNGLYMISFGSSYYGLAGAGSSTIPSVFSNFLNPANLAYFIEESTQSLWEVSIRNNNVESIYNDYFTSFCKDKYYHNTYKDKLTAILPAFGFGTKWNDKIFFSSSFIVKGGGGGNLKNLIFLDENSNYIRENFQVRMVNLSFVNGFGFSLNKLKLGISFDLSLHKIKLESLKKDINNLFIIPYQSFSIDGMDISESWILGSSYVFFKNASSEFTMGFSYHTSNPFQIKGKVKSYENFKNIDSSDILFFRQNIKIGISLPEYYRLGVSYRIHDFVLFYDINYYKWNSYFKNIKFHANYPFITTPLGLRANRLQIRQNWNDQIVHALGFQYKKNHYIYSIGYNYGKIPAPLEGFHPLFTLTFEHHLSLGFTKKENHYSLTFAYEHGFCKKFEYEFSRTNFLSDWFLFHSIKNQQFNYYKYSRKMILNSILIGIEFKNR